MKLKKKIRALWRERILLRTLARGQPRAFMEKEPVAETQNESVQIQLPSEGRISAFVWGVFGKQITCHKSMLSVSWGCMFSLFQGRTGHAEVVRVVYQPERISFEELLKVFWENHDPTQGRWVSQYLIILLITAGIISVWAARKRWTLKSHRSSRIWLQTFIDGEGEGLGKGGRENKGAAPICAPPSVTAVRGGKIPTEKDARQ